MEATDSIASSVTSTSHTLTHTPSMSMSRTSATSGAREDSAVTLFLDSTNPSNRHVFIQPPPLLSTGSLQLAKDTLDGLAGQVVDQQQARLREVGKKRKWETRDKNAILKLRKLHIDGFETGQVWQQAKKIINSTLEESIQLLEELQEGNEVEGPDSEGAKVVEFGEDGFEVDSEDEDASASSQSGDEADSGDLDDELDGSDVSDDEELEGLEEEHSDVEVDGEEEDEDGVEGLKEEDEDEEDDEEESAAELEQDPDGLNDEFFSLKEFNKQTQWFEAQDARADPNTDNHSDDESIDWHGDPFSATAKKSSRGMDSDEEGGEEESDVDMEDAAKPAKSGKDPLSFDDDDDDEGDQAGDLGDLGDMEMDLTANDIYYKDFFAPPARKKKNNYFPKKRQALETSQPDEEDIERAQNDVRRDLFEDDSERSDSEDALSDASAGDPKSRRSAHERRTAKLAAQIRKLESELVAKRAWTLSGEASAVDRPVNSLLEEHLDFEHIGKPVPIITEEVSESIEAIIKRRILAQEFDEVLRRRPDTLGDPNRARRGLVDVEDTKGKQSLAEIYEEEHIKKSNPDAYVSQADEKLSRDEQEIINMWKDVSAKLDALSSWHYKPKPAAPTLTVVADVATVAMEDAQPATAQGVTGGESRMAPQEVYAPGKATAEQGEVVAKSGLPIARQEMSRAEKLRRRRRDKERIRKAGGVDATKQLSRKAQAERETMNDLKKGGVKVINRKGEVMGLDGKKAGEKTAAPTSGSLKL
ncbi:putative U3 small nucleolar ribonucleoprotein [Podospora aff. communis PSN243]|uniref:U3 small nucleolar ribonucleoprotein protein MPP10 n=1 Tax=Podospora aff. communis PSN243 TaxID=3040156 RepID=A0AAV9GH97_9PEZI|nr:putative U3 small nucleolar ribonucleoprotein [Podospora aff. communis PSN243]